MSHIIHIVEEINPSIDQVGNRAETGPAQDAAGIRWPLRFRLMVIIMAVELFLILMVTLLIEYRMRDSVLDQFLKRGLFVGRTLGSVNANYLITKDLDLCG